MSKVSKNKGFVSPIVAVAIAVATLGGGAVTVSAANNSVPGDLLYGLDTALESFQMATSFSQSSKAATRLNIAQEKLTELQALVANGEAAENIAKAAEKLAEHQEAANVAITNAQSQGKDVAELIQLLQDNAVRQQQVLTDVASNVPQEAQPAIQRAMEASQQGLNKATELLNQIPGSGDTGSDNAQSGLENQPETPAP
ncbi:MAG: DUF5667 domain-containing protein [Candidatus Saccharimonadales bacterium]